MSKNIDLHIHTDVSDGELTPKKIIDRAYNNGVSIISITDHDTVDAYTEDLYEYACSKGIKIISGVEISSKTSKATMHILGYNIDINNYEFKEQLRLLRNSRHEYLHNVGKRLSELGYIVNIEKLDKIDAVTKAHIALDIVNNKANEELLLREFNHIPKKGEFIEAIMNEGCIAYVEKKTVTPKEASQLIKKAGGIVILAHPVVDERKDKFTVEEIMNIVKEAEIEGLEANYISIENDMKIDECEKWNKIAKENNLMTTIGSDFHKKDGSHPDIGLINENINLNDEEIERIINNLRLNI
ncbi:MAG: PHP domain-containing protein [Clostridia bacterium]|nr:PHP domain-containing protein [Clostridia bacterium]